MNSWTIECWDGDHGVRLAFRPKGDTEHHKINSFELYRLTAVPEGETVEGHLGDQDAELVDLTEQRDGYTVAAISDAMWTEGADALRLEQWLRDSLRMVRQASEDLRGAAKGGER